MSIKREENGFLFNHELPHDLTMDRLGLDLKDLSSRLRAQIKRIDMIYEKALEDGYVDQREEQELISESYKVATAIEKEHNGGKSSGDALTLIGGLLLLAGTAIGIRQLSR